MSFRLICAAAAIIFVLTINNILAMGKTSIGIKGGLNLSNLYGEHVHEDLMVRPGLIFGALLHVESSDKFAIQPELLFSMKGYTTKENGITERIGFRYIEIPVLFQYLLASSGPVIPQFYAGPAISFKAGVDIKNDLKVSKEMIDFYESYLEELEESKSRSMKGVDLGIVLGTGLGVKSGLGGKFLLDLRVTLGLFKIDKLTERMKYSGITEKDLAEVKNFAFSVLAGYLFEF